MIDDFPAVDCEYSWSVWSSCIPCGVGLISRTMIVSQPSANGGMACPSAQVQTVPCISALCFDCSVPSYGPDHLACLNSGVCNDTVPFNSAFTCTCPSGFTGSNCQIGGSNTTHIRTISCILHRPRRLLKLNIRAKPNRLHVRRSMCGRCAR